MIPGYPERCVGGIRQGPKMNHQRSGRKAKRQQRWFRSIGAKVSFVVAVLALLLAAGAKYPAAAQTADSLHIGRMQVMVMPEYDQPRVLVQAQGRLLEPSLPTTLTLRLPAGAQVLHACATRQPGGDHVCQPFEAQADGDSVLLSYSIPTVDFFVEYVYGFIDSPGQRSLEFTFLPTYPIDELEVAIQEPLRSMAFTLSPPPASQSADQQGFRYHNYSFSSVAPDQPIRFQFSYVKDDVQPSVSPSAEQGSQGNKDALYIIILGLGGLAALALLAHRRLGRLLSPGGVRATSARGPAAPAAPPRNPAAAGRGMVPRFCTQCGSALGGPVRYCPQCGTPAGHGGAGGAG